MARADHLRLVVRATLCTTQPLLVAGGREAGIDAAPFQDSANRYVLPGSGIAGALRAQVAGQLDAFTGIASLFGDSADHGASRLAIADVLLTEVNTELRDGVAIDRTTRAAAPGLKFDRQVIIPGARGTMLLTCDVAANDAELWRQVGADGVPVPAPLSSSPLVVFGLVVESMKESGLRLGSGTSRGQGAVTFENWSGDAFELATKTGMLNLARTRIRSDPAAETVVSAPRAVEANTKPPDDNAPDAVIESLLKVASLAPGASRLAKHADGVIEIGWEPRLPILVDSGVAGSQVDRWPLVVARGSRGEEQAFAVLPATSIKGALRSRAEWIVRTAAKVDCADDQPPLPLVTTLFGSGGSGRRGARRGALRFWDCEAPLVATVPGPNSQKGVKAEAWYKIAGATSKDDDMKVAEAAQALTKAGLSTFTPRAPVAIDRWTGGAAESRLWSEVEPWGLTWGAIRIDLETHRVPSDERAACAALLLLLLEDLVQGEISFGGRSTRGYGSIQVNTTNISNLAGLDPALSDGEHTSGLLTGLSAEARARLAKAFVEKVDD